MGNDGASLEVEAGHRTVRISSPARVVFPERGLTKLDIVQYYVDVGAGILPALQDRPTTLERWPRGVLPGFGLATRGASGEAFFQKRLPRGAPAFVETTQITFPSGRTADQITPNELAVIAWAANLGTITFHPWPVRRPSVDHPDQLRIDLDPQPGTDYADAAALAEEVRALLEDVGLTGFPKTSGGRGLHIFAPLTATHDFVTARRALIALGRELERRRPDAVTTAWWKEERGERVLVDYNQMARDRTMASAYAVRPTQRATVSAPLRWDEVTSVEPDDFDVTTMPDRLADVGDLFADASAGSDSPVAGSLDALLELADRQEADGYGDLPYPPDYPKMPGEPPRVQPSRARTTT